MFMLRQRLLRPGLAGLLRPGLAGLLRPGLAGLLRPGLARLPNASMQASWPRSSPLHQVLCFRWASSSAKHFGLSPSITAFIQRQLANPAVEARHIENTVRLAVEEGEGVPYIVRHCKKDLGGMNEDDVRTVLDLFQQREELERRRAFVRKKIQAAGKLTPGLEAKLAAVQTLAELYYDLYLPFKPRRVSLATKARELGLGPLGDHVWETRGVTTEAKMRDVFATQCPEAVAAGVKWEDALKGAIDIVADHIASDGAVRAQLREAFSAGTLHCSKSRHAEKGVLPMGLGVDIHRRQQRVSDESKINNYVKYFDRQRFTMKRLQPHEVMSIWRGKKEGVLQVRVEPSPGFDMRRFVRETLFPECTVPDVVDRAATEVYERQLRTATTAAVRQELFVQASEAVLDVFARNLRVLLMRPPMRGRWVLGMDPQVSIGTKLALVDPSGRPHPLQMDTVGVITRARTASESKFRELIADLRRAGRLDVIAIGSGMGSAVTVEFVAAALKAEKLRDVAFAVVREDGASVYSVSAEAQREFPDLAPELRSTISIARRLQDPLSELVKCDPKSLSVGVYQRDLPQEALEERFDAVVESCVDEVGVDLATASPALLRRVSGLNQSLAENIIAAAPRSRAELLAVPGIGPAIFRQAAGFVRCYGGPEPLDKTAVHPENYDLAKRLLARLGVDLASDEFPAALKEAFRAEQAAEYAEELGSDESTIKDIVDFIVNKHVDARDGSPQPILRTDVRLFEDVKVGMELEGQVTNIVPGLGVFVECGLDIGDQMILWRYFEWVRCKHDLQLDVGSVCTVRITRILRTERTFLLVFVPPKGGKKRKKKNKETKKGQQAAEVPRTERAPV